MLTVCICEGELGARRGGACLCLPEEPACMLTVCICEGELGARRGGAGCEEGRSWLLPA